MKVLMTGLSSFSGFHIAKVLLESDCKVVAVTLGNYQDLSIKSHRVSRLLALEKDLHLIPISKLKTKSKNDYDVLILHGSYMVDRRSADFDIRKAVTQTTDITKRLIAHGSFSQVIHTGTFSEPNESLGDDPRSLDAYSTSKSLIYEAHKVLFDGVPLHKYVMPNPIGFLQNSNIFTSAFKEWNIGKSFFLENPWLIRDFVPVDLLASDYLQFISSMVDIRPSNPIKRNPSLYIGTLKMILSRVAHIARTSAGMECLIVSSDNLQKSGQQPRIRVNTDIVDTVKNGWDEELWWMRYVNYMIEEKIC